MRLNYITQILTSYYFWVFAHVKSTLCSKLNMIPVQENMKRYMKSGEP
jgi:hypothetical protein